MRKQIEIAALVACPECRSGRVAQVDREQWYNAGRALRTVTRFKCVACGHFFQTERLDRVDGPPSDTYSEVT